MSLAIFAVGVFVFLITVYGTVVTGGLMLTHRQLDDQPSLAPDRAGEDGTADGDVATNDVKISWVRRLVGANY
jgi:hypothetical protein